MKVAMIVTGKVQGVGFRFTTKILADDLHITGSVKNQANGSVYIEAMGEEGNLLRFIERVKASPSPMGKVEHLEIDWEPDIKESSSFDITY